jgi:hypothetical protein
MSVGKVLLGILILVIAIIAILAFLGWRTRVKYINPFTKNSFKRDWYHKTGGFAIRA